MRKIIKKCIHFNLKKNPRKNLYLFNLEKKIQSIKLLKTNNFYFSNNEKINKKKEKKFQTKNFKIKKEEITNKTESSINPLIIDPELEEERIASNVEILKKKEKKNFNIIKKKRSLKESIIHLFQTVKKSLKDLKNDTIYICKLRVEKKKKINFDINEYMKYKIVVYDLIKFIPYSIFLTIPFLEVFLPVYMVLFPNAIPSQFFSEKNIGQKNNAFKVKQKKGYQILKKKLFLVFQEDYTEIKKEINIIKQNENDEEIKNRIIKLNSELMTKIDNEWENNYSNKLKYKNLSLKEKEAILRLFYIEYVNGTNLLSIFINLPKTIYKYTYKLIYKEYPSIKYIKVKIPIFPFTTLQNFLFWAQLKNHFKTIKMEDKLLRKNLSQQIEKCSIYDIFSLIRKRGLDISSEEDCKKYLLKNSLKNSDYDNIDILIWKTVIKHSYAEYLI